MKLTRYGMATLLVAFASVYLVWQGYLIPVAIALAVILAWLHWLAAVEAERTGEPPHGPHGMLTVVAIASLALISMATIGLVAFWLGIGALVLYASIQEWRLVNYGIEHRTGKYSLAYPKPDLQNPRDAEFWNDEEEKWEQFWRNIREDHDR
jgi:hypothetical protein